MSVVSIILRVLLVAVVAVLVGLGALTLSRQQPTRYDATTDLLFSSSQRPELQVLGAPFSRSDIADDLRAATNAALLESFDVARRTARAAPDLGYDANQIAGRVSASPLRGTEIVRLTASGTTPATAVRLAETYRQQFIALRKQRDQRRAAGVENALRQRYEELTPSQRQGAIGASLRTQLGVVAVLKRIGSLDPEVVGSANAPSAPAEPQTRRNVTFGIVFGLALGIGLVALRSDHRRRRYGAPEATA